MMDDDDTGVVCRLQHDFSASAPAPASRELTTTLIFALEALDREEIGPQSTILADVIDPDALNDLFRPVRHRTERSGGHVEFPIDNVLVTVYATGEIVVRERSEPE